MRMSFATADSTGSRLPRIHRFRGKLEVGPHAVGLRLAAAGKTAGLASRLPVRGMRGAAAVPEAFVLHVLSRISSHTSRILLAMWHSRRTIKSVEKGGFDDGQDQSHESIPPVSARGRDSRSGARAEPDAGSRRAREGGVPQTALRTMNDERSTRGSVFIVHRSITGCASRTRS